MAETVYPNDTRRRRASYEEYLLGLEFYKSRQWKTAARHFALAEQTSSYDDVHMHLYMSYQGLSLVLSGDVSGLNLCRHAASMETIQATVFLNLALAEVRFNHRKRACSAIRLGLGIDPRHSELLSLRKSMGMRRRPCLAFLSRSNPVNKWLGRLTYQRLTLSQSH